MRRKTTLLEENLYFLGYRLDHKTYKGKKSEKVDEYVFVDTFGDDVYYVYLNRERTKINSYAFTSKKYQKYDFWTIEDINSIYESIKDKLETIYDFDEEHAKVIETIDLEEANEPFVEESVFDD